MSLDWTRGHGNSIVAHTDLGTYSITAHGAGSGCWELEYSGFHLAESESPAYLKAEAAQHYQSSRVLS